MTSCEHNYSVGVDVITYKAMYKFVDGGVHAEVFDQFLHYS